MTRRCISFLFLGLLSAVRCQWQFGILLEAANFTPTPSVVTIPNSNGTSTLSYQSTEFPIWSSSTGHTTNSTTSGTTSRSTITPTTTNSPTSNGTTTHYPTNASTQWPTTTPVTPTVPMPTLPPEPVAPLVPWNLTYGPNGNNCIMVSFAGRIEITYSNVLNESVQTGLDVSDNATVNQNSSQCQPDHEQQVLVLDLESTLAPNGTLKVTFQQNQANNDSTLYGVELSFRTTEKLFPGLSQSYLDKMVTLSAVNLTLFDTKPEHSYSCVALLKTSLTTTQVNYPSGELNKSPFQNGTFETSNLKVQAFLPSDQKTDMFLPNTVCPQDQDQDISSAIPITVGVVLLILVSIVLIAYFIGRSRQQNYASM